ncbi:MAG: hypothetical protein DWH79_01040, partial [Planctomycetota bacterium]
MPTVCFADGTSRDFPQARRVADIAAGFTGGGKKKTAPIAALLNGKTVGLDAPFPEEGQPRVEWLFSGD